MKNLIQNTLSRIKKEQLVPEPKWKFLLRKFSAWIIVGIVVVFGATAISMAYYLLSQLDWDLYVFVHQNAFIYALSMVPYLWFILLGVFGVAAFFGVRKTENGYRFGAFKIIILIVFAIFAIGFFMSTFGVNRNFNGMMMQGVPYYAKNIATKESQWMQPEKGLIAGTIESINGNVISMRDLENSTWKVQTNGQTLVRPMANVSVGQMIKIIGEKQSAQNFSALEIRPWNGQGMMMRTGSKDGSCGISATNTCKNQLPGGMMNR
jgi:hypothetical protein